MPSSKLTWNKPDKQRVNREVWEKVNSVLTGVTGDTFGTIQKIFLELIDPAALGKADKNHPDRKGLPPTSMRQYEDSGIFEIPAEMPLAGHYNKPAFEAALTMAAVLGVGYNFNEAKFERVGHSTVLLPKKELEKIRTDSCH